MRDYAKVSPAFWMGRTGQEIRKLGPEAILLALYLITNQHANMLGLYYLPLAYIADDTGLTLEGASKGLISLSEVGFCHYDTPSKYVFVVEMAKFQIGDSLDPKDNRVKGVNSTYMSLPSNPFLPVFFDIYSERYHLEHRRDPEAPSKPLRSQEQEQEQEIEQEKEKTIGRVVSKKKSASTSITEELFADFWAEYPKKVGKDAAKKAFFKRNPDTDLVARMIGAVRRQKQTDQWQKKDGQYIPHPATWLNQGRWEDEVEPKAQKRYVDPVFAGGV
jgi:hypothetical protein